MIVHFSSAEKTSLTFTVWQTYYFKKLLDGLPVDIYLSNVVALNKFTLKISKIKYMISKPKNTKSIRMKS